MFGSLRSQELSQLREGAVAGLEERATHYALLAEGHTAHTEARGAAGVEVLGVSVGTLWDVNPPCKCCSPKPQ